MDCPKCDAPMEEVFFEEIGVDRCTNCKGLWFDKYEQGDMEEAKGSEELDGGDPEVGKQHNEKGRYPCPKCRGTMVRLADHRQHHIWYEKCVKCRGSFFDAGEFTDLRDHTIADFFKDLATPERP